METFVIEKSNAKVEVLPDLEALSLRAASTFVSVFRNSIATKRRFAVEGFYEKHPTIFIRRSDDERFRKTDCRDQR